jgi:hypothetical protein
MQDVLPVVAVVVGLTHQGHTRRLSARVELEPHRLHVAADAIFQADRERVPPMDNCSPPLQQQASTFLGARHQRLLALIYDKDRHVGVSLRS